MLVSVNDVERGHALATLVTSVQRSCLLRHMCVYDDQVGMHLSTTSVGISMPSLASYALRQHCWLPRSRDGTKRGWNDYFSADLTTLCYPLRSVRAADRDVPFISVWRRWNWWNPIFSYSSIGYDLTWSVKRACEAYRPFCTVTVLFVYSSDSPLLLLFIF